MTLKQRIAKLEMAARPPLPDFDAMTDNELLDYIRLATGRDPEEVLAEMEKYTDEELREIIRLSESGLPDDEVLRIVGANKSAGI